MAALALLTLFALIVAAGILLQTVRHMIERCKDPEHLPRRTAGITAVITGSILFGLGVAYFIGLLFEPEVAVLEARFHEGEPFFRSPFQGNVSQLVGLNLLSAWLLLAGAVVALGMSLKAKRFSLQSLLVAVFLVAFTASIPHLLVQPREPHASIEATVNRVMTAEEWTALERALSRERLCGMVSEETEKALPCPVTHAVTRVEIQPIDSERLPLRVERHGPVGIRLTLWFADRLSQEQIERLFDELCTHIENSLHQTAGERVLR